MARVPQVTRTIITTNAKILCVNTETKAVEEIEVTIPRTYKDGEDILKYLKKVNYDFENKKPVSVTSYDTVEKLYGMTEEEFVKLAKELPPRTAGDTEDDEPEQPKATKKNSKKN